MLFYKHTLFRELLKIEGLGVEGVPGFRLSEAGTPRSRATSGETVMGSIRGCMNSSYRTQEAGWALFLAGY